MSDSLKTKTLHGVAWSVIDWCGVSGVQFIISVLLARLLLPEQFGLIGMLTIFMALAQSFLDSGFGSALIQKQDATHKDECSIFYFNIGVGVAAAGLLCLAAPWIANFFNEPLLTPICCVLSLNIVINSFGLIQNALMTKRVDFKTRAKISTLASVLSGTIGVGMAFCGFGVWSLVAQSIASNVFGTLLLWIFNSWRPSLTFSFTSLQTMFGFGSRMFASGILNTIFENIYSPLIGKLFSAVELGFYNRALGVQALPSRGLYTVIGRVMFPVFASVQNDPERLKRGLQKVLRVAVLINFPLMIGLAIIAKPFVMLLFTEKWAPCVPYLQILCISGLLYPLHSANVNILMALGRSDLFFRIEVLKKIIIIVSILIAYRWGVEGLIYGQIITSILAYFLNSYYTGVLLHYSAKEQISDLLPTFGAAIAMGAIVYPIQWLMFLNNWSVLISQVAVGAVAYVAMCVFFRLSAFIEAWDLFVKRIPLSKMN